MRVLAVALSLALLLLGSRALANPIAAEVLRVRQVPHTLHVQVTYAVADPFGTPAIPSSTTRDGSPLSPTWSDPLSFSTNMGSGITNTKAIQFCDCGVPIGSHKYQIKVQSAMGGTPAPVEVTLDATITVVQNLGDPADAGVPHGDMNPWEIPDPSQIQGIDCQQTCSAPPADGGVTKKDSAGPATKDSSGPTKDSSATIKPKEDSGGCAVAGHGPASALFLLLGLGLLWGARRRRA